MAEVVVVVGLVIISISQNKSDHFGKISSCWICDDRCFRAEWRIKSVVSEQNSMHNLHCSFFSRIQFRVAAVLCARALPNGADDPVSVKFVLST